MSTVPERFWRSKFWQRWVLANALGELFGLGTVAAVGFLVFQRAGEPTNTAQALAFALVFVLLGAFEGLVIGLAQRHVLRTLLPAARGWVLATVVGALVAWAIGMVPSTIASLMQQDATLASSEPPFVLVLLLAAGLGAVAGPLLAAFQWLSLRKALPGRAWLWLPANAAAWALGMPVIFLGAQANELTSNAAAIAALVALAILVAGAVVGAVHGRILLGLVQRGSPVGPRMEIREAAPGEAAALTSLSLEAKAHWGYSKGTLDSWKDQLEVLPSDVASKPTYVGSIDGNIIGFYSLVPSDSTWELDNLWVAPRFMNRGLGEALLAHAREVAFRGGATSVAIDADPNAESFYLSCGAVRCGEVPAPIAGQPNRVRPQLAFNGRAT